MISVVMPAYNSAKTIADSIDSVLNQTYPHFELIIIDDGSTDNTVEIVQSYVEKDKRVRLLKQKNAGVSAARNVGLEAAQFPWIALLDSDDLAVPHRFEKQIALIESDPEVIAWGSAIRHMGVHGEVTNDVKEVGPATKAESQRLKEAGELFYFATATAIFRRDIALKINGFDVRFRSAGDTDFFNRLSEHGPLVAIKEPLVIYRIHTQGIMAKRWSELYRNTRFLEARIKAQKQGNTLAFEDFIQDYNNKPLVARFFRYTDCMSQLHYRNAGAYLGSRQYVQSMGSLALAAILNPSLILGRIWRRLLKSRTA